MDAYLLLAERVIREARRPLSAREILKRAYPAGGVPSHLHGRTQHKTLGARLAEDILKKGERSIFFRNAPGKYFLTQYLSDGSIPLQYRQRFVTRRRSRQLAQSRPLAFKMRDLPGGKGAQAVPIELVMQLLETGAYHYPLTTKNIEPDDVTVWSFVMVFKGSRVLTYRHGQYREDRDTFRNRRAVGFFAPVLEGDRALFDLQDHGIISRGVSTISIDLGLTTAVDLFSPGNRVATLDCFIRHEDGSAATLLSIIHFDAPEWFEPYTRRLAINDLMWVDFGIPQNSRYNLDPWSAAVLKTMNGRLSLRAPRSG